jgi:D-xylose transport system substrate-binding protein
MKRYAFLFCLISSLVFGQSPKHIGFLMDDFYSPRWIRDSTAFASKVRELGHKVSIRVCYSDTALQHKQVKELITLGVNVLVVTPEDCKSSSVLVETAHKYNVPVIAYDRIILNSDVDYYISFDASEVGEIQAQFIVDSLHGEGNIILINGPTSDENATVFRQGQLKVLKPYVDSGKIKIVHDKQISEWTLLEATMETNDFLSSTNVRVDAAIAANDELAEGVIEAFAFTRPEIKLLITGQDANPLGCERIRKGTQGMTVYKPVEDLAHQAAILACDIAMGKKTTTTSFVNNGKKEVPFIRLDPMLVNKKNINKILPN